MDYFKLSEMLFEKFFLSEDLQTDRDEIISYGASVCELKEPKFNPSKGKEFHYFTTISLCAMRQLAAAIRRKNSKIKYKIQCDSELNTPEVIALNELRARITLYE